MWLTKKEDDRVKKMETGRFESCMVNYNRWLLKSRDHPRDVFSDAREKKKEKEKAKHWLSFLETKCRNEQWNSNVACEQQPGSLTIKVTLIEKPASFSDILSAMFSLSHLPIRSGSFMFYYIVERGTKTQGDWFNLV